MARSRRIFIPGLSAHVIQRGNNRMSIFRRDVDYKFFIAFLQRAAGRYGVDIHGYVFMTNHVHLIVTPRDALSLPHAMQHVGARYSSYYNRKYERTGTIWNGRYRSLPIQDERYWLTCLRYVEQNPVRAAMVDTPDRYQWSSYGAHALGAWPEWLTAHRVYLALGHTPAERQAAYRALCGTPLPDDELQLLHRGQSGV